MKAILTLVFIMSILNGYAQTTQTRYFKSSTLQKQVAAEKGKYKQTVTQYPDGTVRTEIVDIKKDKVLSVEVLKGEESIDIWKYQRGNHVKDLDYSFEVVYSDARCQNSIETIDDYFKNSESPQYVAPKIATGEASIYEFLGQNLIYPSYALQHVLDGKVHLQFTITADGIVKNIVVKDGVHISLDKEAVRVIRNLKFSSPPTINGQPTEVCVTLPVRFEFR